MFVPSFHKYASIIYRCGNRYYDRVLAPFCIGCGQQFFLARIAEQEGISMYDLASNGRFDKGTVTRAVQKLEELGYLRSSVSAQDRRIRNLYTTEAARPVLRAIKECRGRWMEILTAGLSPAETAQAEDLLKRLAQNAYQCTAEGGKETHE